MEEKNYIVNLLLVLEKQDYQNWLLSGYYNIDLKICFDNVCEKATVGGVNYSKQDLTILLEKNILTKKAVKGEDSLINCSCDKTCVYISKVMVDKEIQELNRKLHSNASYTYDEIENTFVNPYIEDTKEKSSERDRYAKYWDDYINSRTISNAEKKMIKTNIFMVFERNLITNEPFILKDFTECDLANFISSSSDKYKRICNRSIERLIIEWLLSEHTYLDLEVDDEKEYIYAYIDKEMSLEEKEGFRLSLSKAILSSKHFEVSEIQNMCCYKPSEEILKAKENSINKSIREETEKKEQVKKKKNIVIEGLKEGVILNNKNYITDPAVGRETEIENLIISLAQRRKCPILVGESGVGKTAIVDKLVYMIQNDKVPSFLNNKVIVEVSASDLLAGTRYRGDLEEKLKKLFETAEENNLILFIDEIHLMYDNGCGAEKSGTVDMASILRNHIDRFGLKVIGATTAEEYSKYFANDSLKRRFDKIKVKEPDNYVLNMIIMSTFKTLSQEDNISSDELLHNFPNIITNLIQLTNEKHRVRDDKENNPSLIIGIIETSYAYAKVYDKETLEIDHIIKGINSCERLSALAKKEGIERVLDDKPLENDAPKCKIIQFNP